MKIQRRHFIHDEERWHDLEVASFIASQLTEAPTYSEGHLERIQEHIHDLANFIGQLVELLPPDTQRALCESLLTNDPRDRDDVRILP